MKKTRRHGESLFQKALPYEKNYYLLFDGAKLLPKNLTASKNRIKKG
jgi:hypothetical protein